MWDHFWDKVVEEGECWVWTGHRSYDGYGRFGVGGIPRNAHRVSYRWLAGPIPPGLVLDHLCRVRACVRPDHLEAVTIATNARRSGEVRK